MTSRVRSPARCALVVGALACWTVPAAPASAAAADRSGPYVDTVAELVDALKVDPVLVQQTMGSGDTEAAHDRLTALAADLPFPAYVALIDPPLDLQADDLPQAIATALHREIGVDGLYYVSVRGRSDDVEMFGVTPDSSAVRGSSYVTEDALDAALTRSSDPDDRISLSTSMEAEVVLRTAALPGVEDFAYDDTRDVDQFTGSPILPDATIARLARASYAFQDRADHVRVGDESVVGKRFALGTAAGLLLAMVLQMTLRRAWPGWRAVPETAAARKTTARENTARKTTARKNTARKTTASKTAPEPVRPTPFFVESVRAEAETALTRLSEAVATLPTMTSRTADAADAQDAREAAAALLEPGESGQPRDLLGALVLARGGLVSVQRVLAETPPPAYRPCFLNPLHDAADTERSFAFGDDEVEVPVCKRCAADLDAHREVDVLRIGTGRKRKPYYEGDDVWARTGYGSLVEHPAAVVLRNRAGQDHAEPGDER